MKILLYPISVIYNFFVSTRNLFFDIGIFKSIQYKIPTIGVGNLSTGGTGKSIIVDYLIELLKKNRNVTTLSRGFNRDTRGFIKATSKSSAFEIGDEPYQFYSKHPEINVVVCEDRRKGMKLIMNDLPNTQVCIWDDIFQHRFVKPGLMILTTTFRYPYYKDQILPMGNLRESKGSSKRANIIVVTKCPNNLNRTDKDFFISKLQPEENQKVFFSSIVYKETLKGNEKNIKINDLKNSEFLLVTGIADSSYLVNFLKSKGLKFKHLKYADHYNFKQVSINKINSLSVNKYIITTEKDFGRLSPKIQNRDVFYIEVSIEFPRSINHLSFDETINSFIEKN